MLISEQRPTIERARAEEVVRRAMHGYRQVTIALASDAVIEAWHQGYSQALRDHSAIVDRCVPRRPFEE